MMDTVLNEFMRPLFSHEPSEMKRRLKKGYSDSCTNVLVGETGSVVTVNEYLYGEKLTDIRAMLKEILRKHDLPMYKRNPERMDVYLDSAVRKIIERALQS